MAVSHQGGRDVRDGPLVGVIGSMVVLCVRVKTLILSIHEVYYIPRTTPRIAAMIRCFNSRVHGPGCGWGDV